MVPIQLEHSLQAGQQASVTCVSRSAYHRPADPTPAYHRPAYHTPAYHKPAHTMLLWLEDHAALFATCRLMS